MQRGTYAECLQGVQLCGRARVTLRKLLFVGNDVPVGVNVLMLALKG